MASEDSGAPEGAWGDRFFTVGPDRRQPFATIVDHDVPGFDEASRLDRPGVFRLNLDLGRAEFEPEIDRLLAIAHARAVDRHERASRRAAGRQG